jgi:hypothetical protein
MNKLCNFQKQVMRFQKNTFTILQQCRICHETQIFVEIFLRKKNVFKVGIFHFYSSNKASWMQCYGSGSYVIYKMKHISTSTATWVCMKVKVKLSL